TANNAGGNFMLWTGVGGGFQDLYFTTSDANGWKPMKIVADRDWVTANFPIGNYLPLAGGTMTGNINLMNGNANLTHGSSIRLRTTADSLVLAGNTTSVGLGIFLRPQGDSVTTGQVLID